MLNLDEFRASLDGALYEPGSASYEAAQMCDGAGVVGIRPRLVVACGSEADVTSAIAYAAGAGLRLVPRGGGHGFAGRSSTDGILLDVSALNDIAVDVSGTVRIGAGARLGDVYRSLHAHGRSLPAGCGATVGIAGLALGGGIGLLGRRFGLTCDRLLSARVVLADGEIAECDERREPDLFWALRGAGGGQFGVVTALRFATVPEPDVVRIDARWADTDIAELMTAWQGWAPDVPDGLTLNLAIEKHPHEPRLHAQAFGVSALSRLETTTLLRRFLIDRAVPDELRLSEPMPYSAVKETLADESRSSSVGPIRLRSEFFENTITQHTLSTVLALLQEPGPVAGEGVRRLAFTAMGGAYNQVSEEATAFAHRDTRFMLEHVGDPDNPWINASWEAAHADGSGRVYPNFPDPLLDDPLHAYHGVNTPRLARVKRSYDPGQFFDFPQAIRPTPSAGVSRAGSRRNEVPS
ncbi:FAD-binding oxidoreductase [Microbacterium dextranolyticum]|uniref:FAD-binding dehydrogenase n=1 Tax=Microbacterium dextranolyticum TaxID=36806 RepID=A0A9W6M704_9MICO|nr:FAD-binding oxidoreductase [Microbacterium dextranolyticum]MBM7462548.1 hypothetical protein [Microbacterium dextranolyticum]GLJ96406.1 FAD-binding dehydrogenase [Microbacterium dextranolyticum]